MTGDRSGRQLSLATRRELIQAIAGRYHSAVRSEKKKILDEFIKVTGFHREHAIRALKPPSGNCSVPPPRSCIYDEGSHGRADNYLGGCRPDLWEAAKRGDPYIRWLRWNDTGICNWSLNCAVVCSR